MVETIYKWLLEIPSTLAKFGDWLTKPIDARYLNISPLALFGIGGVTIIIVLIVTHVVRLFTI